MIVHHTNSDGTQLVSLIYIIGSEQSTVQRSKKIIVSIIGLYKDIYKCELCLIVLSKILNVMIQRRQVYHIHK